MKIRFIGNIGVGKTTAICCLLKLTDSKGVPILDTGAGRTTACDVHIRLLYGENKSSISIQNYNYNQFDDLLGHLIQRPHLIPVEIQRILKNIINYCGEINFESELSKIKLNDPVEVKNFRKKCRIKARYAYRNILSIEDPNICDILWAKENFKKINNGNHPRFGIPKLINLNININHLNSLVNFQNLIFVDTKGLEYNNNINLNSIDFKDVYCSSFTAGPENNLVRSISNSKNIKINKYILVISKNNDPEEVAGAFSYEEGVQIKLQQFIRITKNIIFPQNIMFIDTKRIDDKNREYLFTKIIN